jgi:DNA-binding MarR family transcriptional regulator
MCDNNYNQSMRLEDEIRQTRPFDSQAQAAHLSIARTAAVLEHAIEAALRPHGVTGTQYNVLRILRGAGAEGLCRREVTERMIRPVPDATRLLDRMEAGGLIERERSGADRRFVSTRLTPRGREIVDRLDVPIRELHERHFGGIGADALAGLVGVLEQVRAGVDPDRVVANSIDFGDG